MSKDEWCPLTVCAISITVLLLRSVGNSEVDNGGATSQVRKALLNSANLCWSLAKHSNNSLCWWLDGFPPPQHNGATLQRGQQHSGDSSEWAPARGRLNSVSLDLLLSHPFPYPSIRRPRYVRPWTIHTCTVGLYSRLRKIAALIVDRRRPACTCIFM